MNARRAFLQQRAGAKQRGIGWELTFEQWLAWWGDDLSNRGSRPWNLQMQRVADSGPYALGNIRKGTPQQNAKTNGHVMRGRNAAEAKARLEAARDADPGTSDGEYKLDLDDDDAWLRSRLGIRQPKTSAWR